MKKLQIYVAGIPTSTTTVELSACFSRHSYLVRVETTSKFPTGDNSQRFVLDGHCVISVADTTTYESILTNKRILLRGRRLMCSEFLTGTKLYKLNAMNNKRRIILKYVPSYLSEIEVKDSLERQFGKVERFFSYLSEHKEADESRRRYKAYSVMFDQISVAQVVADRNVIELKYGINATVEKYNRKRVNKVPEARTSKGTTCNLSTIDNLSRKNLASTNLTCVLPASQPIVKCPENKTFHFRSKPRAKTMEDFPKSTQFNTRRTCSVERSAIVARGNRRTQFIEELRAVCPHLKPNSKIYRLLRSEDFEYIATFELSNAWISLTNFRQNHMQVKGQRIRSPTD